MHASGYSSTRDPIVAVQRQRLDATTDSDIVPDLKSRYCFCAHMHEITKYFLFTENRGVSWWHFDVIIVADHRG